ncbi:MAG: AI-2E family transporter [bacterium]|nr:AI-2E family transporter [bacterium]
MTQSNIIERYFFFGLLLATLLFTFFIFKPFWIVIVLSISFSIVLYPLYTWLVNKSAPKWLASLISVIFFTILLCGPIFGIGAIVFNQSQELYNTITLGGNEVETFINKFEVTVNRILPAHVNFDAKEKISDIVLFLSNNLGQIFSTTLSTFFNFTLMLLAIFYFLKDGRDWKKSLVKLSPLTDTDDHKIVNRITKAVNGVIKGYLLIALLQGILMSIGLWIFGIANPALWGVVAAIGSLIPMVGTAFVSAPAIIFLFATGSTTSAIGLLIWAIVVVGTVDNILNPHLIGGKINVPPLVILFSVLGGISLLGPVGVIVGPLTISFLYTLISIYKNQFSEPKPATN